MSRRRHLLEMAPGLDRRFPAQNLLEGPTPVTEAQELARHWKLRSLWIKRDDLTSPAYGGSKVRNLEYFLGHAKLQGATTLATMGPQGSHQALAAAVHGAACGFRTRSLLLPQQASRETELNRRLLPAFGMQVLRCEHWYEAPLAYARTRWGGEPAYWIPPGSKHPLGVLGIIEGALELAAAIRNKEFSCPDDVVVPTGTCATAAGLYLGLAMARLPVRLVAVRLVPMMITGPGKMRRLAEQTLAILRSCGYRDRVDWGETLWIDDYAAPGYGIGNASSQAAARDVLALGGFRTEVTYTEKCLGLLADGKLSDRKVLFWNTYSAVDPQPPVYAAGAAS
jgi:D-cysteine desulfhydrase